MTVELGATMSWHDELMMTCGAEPLATGNISRRLAAVHKVLRHAALQTPMNGHSELELDMMMCQAAVELVGSTDDLAWLTLKTISGGLGRPGQHSVAAVNA